MHDTSFYNNETTQSVTERQQLLITSDGLYDVQSITVTINMSEVLFDDSSHFILEWGNRSTNISLSTLLSNNGKNNDNLLASCYLFISRRVAFCNCRFV